jgi:enoyl-CoA hydratase/carnithine racemase
MPDIVYEKHARFAIFTLNRPERLNAQSERLREELHAALADFTADPAMRVGILTGAGRAFSAGIDLKESAERRANETVPAELQSMRSYQEFSDNPKPFIAAINGLCISGGLERAIDCDIRICSTAATFGLFEVKRGIMAGYAIHHLARLMPFGEAMYVLLTGDTISADQALRWGLVHEVLALEALLPRAMEIAELIAANAPLSVQGTKAVAQFWRQHALDESYAFGDTIMTRVMRSEDAREGPRAFAEKRPPVWQGR